MSPDTMPPRLNEASQAPPPQPAPPALSERLPVTRGPSVPVRAHLAAAGSRSWLRRWRFRLPLLLLALAGAGYAALPAILGPVVAPIPVLRADLVATVVATGRVETPHRASIAAQVTGTIAAIPVAEGARVAAGQLLVQLADTEARASLAQAEAALAQAEARLVQIAQVAMPVAREARAQADANLVQATRAHERITALRAAGTGTEAQADEARRVLAVAEAAARSARLQQAGLEPGGIERTLAETAAAQARASIEVARARLDYTQIRAPVAGTLIARNVEPGFVVQPGQALMVLSPEGRTQLVVQIDEKNLSLIALGQAARASADAFPDRGFQAVLAYINPAVDAQRAAIEVKLDVADPPAELRQDMTVSVDIAVAERKGVVVVPLAAVRDVAAPAPFVLAVEGGRAVRRPVRLGLRGPTQAEVTEGLAPGALILPADARVRPGGPVRLAEGG